MNQLLPSDTELEKSLYEILKDANLSITTPKIIRQQLEALFGVNLDSKKSFISELTKKCLSERVLSEPDSIITEEKSHNKPKRRPPKLWFSDELTILLLASPTEISTRGEVVRFLWNYIKSHNLQDKKDKRRIICDDTLEKLFKTKSFTMFKMNKILSNHIKRYDQMV